MAASLLFYNLKSVTRFDGLVENDLRSLLMQCAHSISQFSAVKVAVHEESVNYLDLALTSPKHICAKKEAKNVFYTNLPYPCMEFFLAETFQPTQKILTVYKLIISCINRRLSIFQERLDRFRNTMFVTFESKIFDKIEEKESDQKINIIKTYLAVYQRLPVDRFSAMYPDLLNLCTNPPLDSELTIDLLMTFCDTDYKKMSIFSRVPNARCLETIILHAKDMRFDFWGLWSGTGMLVLTFDFIPFFMELNLNQEYSTILLKYGFPYMTGPDEFRIRCVRIQNTRFEGRSIIRSVRSFSNHADSEKRIRMMLIMDTFTIIGDFADSPDAPERVLTLKYLTRSLPYPYITPRELYKTMLQVVVPDFQPQLMAIAFWYANTDIFESDHMNSMPRRLEHLCRVAVRKILADNFMLLDGIQRLPIPAALKTYLRLES